MPALTTTELAAFRTHAEELLTDTCTIQQVTRTADSIGGWSESWTNRGTAISCRLAQHITRSERDSMGVGRLQESQYWTLSLAHSQTIAVTDRVVVDSETYEVVALNDDDTERVLTRATLRRAD